MFLSALILNPRCREARTDLSDPYELHRTLSRAFPDQSEGGAGDVLWRLDVDRRSGMSSVLVQSSLPPRWENITQRSPEYFALREAGRDALKTRELPALQFVAGQCFHFRLRANPTVKREGKRHGLLTEEEQSNWLVRKGGNHGFRLLNVRVVSEPPRESREKGRSMKFASVLFDGQLCVTDPDQFAAAWREGIGSAKGFGFGLLSIARCE